MLLSFIIINIQFFFLFIFFSQLNSKSICQCNYYMSWTMNSKYVYSNALIILNLKSFFLCMYWNFLFHLFARSVLSWCWTITQTFWPQLLVWLNDDVKENREEKKNCKEQERKKRKIINLTSSKLCKICGKFFIHLSFMIFHCFYVCFFFYFI